jgi:hypothetical protein
MGRYDHFRKREERPWKVHPVWRGIGCLWMILIPILSYVGAWMFTRENFKHGWLPITEELSARISLPVYDFSFLSFPLDFNILVRWLPGQPLYNIDILFFIAFLFLGLGMFSVIYAFLFRSLTPGRSPLDAPEVERQRPRKRY